MFNHYPCSRVIYANHFIYASYAIIINLFSDNIIILKVNLLLLNTLVYTINFNSQIYITCINVLMLTF